MKTFYQTKDPLPSCVREEMVFSLCCGLPSQVLVKLHHTLVEVHALFWNQLKPRHVAIRVLLTVVVPQLSCKGEREGGEGGCVGQRVEGGREGGREGYFTYTYTMHTHTLHDVGPQHCGGVEGTGKSRGVQIFLDLQVELIASELLMKLGWISDVELHFKVHKNGVGTCSRLIESTVIFAMLSFIAITLGFRYSIAIVKN